MALISYNQQDDSVTFDAGCSGETAGATTDGRAMDDTAAGTTEFAADPGNNVTRACAAFAAATAPGVASWASGTWGIPVNHTTMDGGTQLVGVYVCDRNGAAGSFTTVASNTSPGHTRGATGVTTVNVTQGSDHTPQSEANSRPWIILVYNNNDQHGSSALGITPDQVITTPIDVVAGITGTGTVTLAALASTGSGTVDVVGNATATLAALTGSGAAGVDVVGSGTATLAALAAAGVGTSLDVTEGTGALNLPAITVAADGDVLVDGMSVSTFGALAAQGTAEIDIVGSGNAVLAALMAASESGGGEPGGGPGRLSTPREVIATRRRVHLARRRRMMS